MSLEIPRKIEKSDLEVLPIEIGGTEIILQRHGEYERSSESPKVGSLTESGAKDVHRIGKKFFKTLFENIPDTERKDVDILVIASDTQYREGGRRSMETADEIMDAIREALKEFGLDERQLLNLSKKYAGEGGPRPTPGLREPQIFNNSPDFLAFMKEKYGDLGKEFWIAFEEDAEKETREQMGAEGPDQIADRIVRVIEVLKRYGRMYHGAHPDKRLVLWAATHYDTISPFVKREVLGVGKDAPLGVDYAAGIPIVVAPDGTAKTRINGREYNLSDGK